MSETPPEQPAAKPLSEDRRRPKAPWPYLILWGVTVVCVIFALVVMLNQG